MISKTIGYNGVHNIFRHTHIETKQIDKQRWLAYVISPIVPWTYYNDDSRQRNNLNDQTLRALRATGFLVVFWSTKTETLCEPSWISRNKNLPDEGDQAWPAHFRGLKWLKWPTEDFPCFRERTSHSRWFFLNPSFLRQRVYHSKIAANGIS